MKNSGLLVTDECNKPELENTYKKDACVSLGMNRKYPNPSQACTVHVHRQTLAVA